MTRNKKIAEQMGWAYNPNDYIKGTPHFFCTAKLLQAKMVADGWNIDNRNEGLGIFYAIAWRENLAELTFTTGTHKTEPAAIVDLFCKVYGITDEN